MGYLPIPGRISCMPTITKARDSTRLLRALRDINTRLCGARDTVTACRIAAEQVVDLTDLEAVAVCVPRPDSELRIVYATQGWTSARHPGLPLAIEVCE